MFKKEGEKLNLCQILPNMDLWSGVCCQKGFVSIQLLSISLHSRNKNTQIKQLRTRSLQNN